MALAVGIAFGAASRSAPAQTPTPLDIARARSLFHDAMRLRDQGERDAEIRTLEAARAATPTPIIDLELGRAYAAAGRLISARRVLVSVADLAPQPAETPRSAAARAEAARLAADLQRRIPTVTVRLVGSPNDAIQGVQVDDAPVAAERLAGALPLDPGVHAISVQSSSGGSSSVTLELKEGEHRDVDVAIEPAPTAPARPNQAAPPAAAGAKSAAAAPISATVAPRSGGRSSMRTIGLVVGGIGLAALGAGAYFGVRTLSDKSTIDQACHGGTCTSQAAIDAADDALTASVVSDVALAAGAVVLGVGAYLVLASSGAPRVAGLRVRPSVGLSGASPRASLTGEWTW
ncbi:MAG TPA: hypothetical protein VE987_13130 [Polyangiaceae bacterium]|nr:hypothetical protein [Polyangiaceae bacterium]